ncbi:unnamed protein product [Clonostachys rosea]|uniref:Uncharacterized protein n=1 Tax=Bionectria ochroleuca TaxID=29856 RepID=A0ABY6TV85_BIOOC|nr:unnamed protein product [Clonostachys rosea]
MAGGLEDRAVMSTDWYENGFSPGLKFALTDMWEGGLCWKGAGAGNEGGGVVGGGVAWDIYRSSVVEGVGWMTNSWQQLAYAHTRLASSVRTSQWWIDQEAGDDDGQLSECM